MLPCPNGEQGDAVGSANHSAAVLFSRSLAGADKHVPLFLRSTYESFGHWIQSIRAKTAALQSARGIPKSDDPGQVLRPAPFVSLTAPNK